MQKISDHILFESEIQTQQMWSVTDYLAGLNPLRVAVAFGAFYFLSRVWRTVRPGDGSAIPEDGGGHYNAETSGADVDEGTW